MIKVRNKRILNIKTALYGIAILTLSTICLNKAFCFALHDTYDQYSPSSSAMILEDTTDLDIETIRHLPDSAFKQNTTDFLTIDNGDSYYWVKFTFRYYPKSSVIYKNWFLEIASPSLDILDLYFIENGNITSHHLGDDRPFNIRPVQHANYIVDFRTHSKYETLVYIRIKNSAATTLPIRVWTHQALFAESQILYYLAGLCYGVLLIMAIYNMVTAITVRDKTHGYLSIYIITALFCLMSYDGFASQFIWPNSPWWEDRALFFWETLVLFWAIHFSRNLVDFRYSYPKSTKILYFIQSAAICLTIISIAFPANIYSIYITSFFGLITIIYIVPVYKHTTQIERTYFIFSWVPLYIVVTILILGKIEPSNLNVNDIDRRYIYYPLLTIHFIMLSLALTNRYNAIKKSKEKAEQHALTSLQRYKDLFTNAAAGMFEISHNGEILYINPTIIKMLGYKSEEELKATSDSLGKSLFVNEVDRFRYLKLLVQNGRVTNFEFQYKRKNGEIRWGMVSSCLVINSESMDYTNNMPNIEGSVIDITASKDKEKIEKRLIEAETSANVKAQLLASSSHELRTPMNAIIGFTSLLQKTNLDEKQYNYADKVRVAANGLLRLINDILDNSKLEAGEMKIESVNFNLEQLLSEVIDMFAEPFNEKGIELILLKKPDLPINLIGDPLRINQVLINLINNAMKFTSEGCVAINIEYIHSLEDSIDLYITISDTGIGISSDRCERIFDPYQQADSSVAKLFGGTGLGLSVCKKLIEKMGGQINVQSVVGKGAEFMFSIHVGVQPSMNENEITIYDELTGKKAFIIDSNKFTVKQLKDELSRFKIDAVSVSSGEMALQRLISLGEADQYDFIIIERNLIDNSGINIIKELKFDSSTSLIPIILTSKTGFDDLTDRDKNCGISEFLVKPIKNNTLLKSLINLFNLEYVAPLPGQIEHNDLNGIFLNKNILLVEDNELNQELFVELLANTEATIDIANTGVVAIEKIKEVKYDIIMMDIQMPVLNGIEATKIIRNNYKELIDVPIIALTANALDSDIKEYYDAGMNDFISKPIDFTELTLSIKRWLNIEKNIHLNCHPFGEVKQSNELKKSTDQIDFMSGLKKLGGNKKLYYKILGDFVVTYKKEKESIYEMINAHDITNLARKFHSIKGISFNLGIDTLGELAKSTEEVLKDSDLPTNLDFGVIKSQADKFYNLLESIEIEVHKITENQE